MRRILSLGVAAMLLSTAVTGCGDEDKDEAAAAPDVDPRFTLDGLTGRWIRVNGNAPSKEHRFEVHKSGKTTELWATNGGWTKRRMVGEQRASDWKFTEVLPEAEAAKWKSGARAKTRFYLKPEPAKGSWRITELEVANDGGNEVEKQKGQFQEYVPFPDKYDFTFRPCDGALFLGDAAKDPAKAAKEVEEEGGPFPGHALGEAIPVGIFLDAAADGDASCTYDMDLFFDDLPAKGKDDTPRAKVPAGEVVDGKRPWLVADWYAPFGGNHHLQIYRYRTCSGGDRELIGVQCVEAVLE